MNNNIEIHRVLLVDPTDLTDAYLADIKNKYTVFYNIYKSRTFVEYDTSARGGGYHFAKLISPYQYKLDDIFYIHEGNLGMRFVRNGSDEIPTLFYINNFRPLKENFQVPDPGNADISVYFNDIDTKHIDKQALEEFRSLFRKTPPTNSGGSSRRRKTKRRKIRRRKTMRRKTKKTKRKN